MRVETVGQLPLTWRPSWTMPLRLGSRHGRWDGVAALDCGGGTTLARGGVRLQRFWLSCESRGLESVPPSLSRCCASQWWMGVLHLVWGMGLQPWMAKGTALARRGWTFSLERGALGVLVPSPHQMSCVLRAGVSAVVVWFGEVHCGCWGRVECTGVVARGAAQGTESAMEMRAGAFVGEYGGGLLGPLGMDGWGCSVG